MCFKVSYVVPDFCIYVSIQSVNDTFLCIIALYLKSKKDSVRKTIFFDKEMGFSRITVTPIEEFHDNSDYSEADLEECFFFFLQEFGPIASGYKNYNEQQKQITLFQDICTPSDEALIIFFLEINWEDWIEEAENGTPGNKRKLVSTKKFSGWTPDNVKKFNDICRLVSSVRENENRIELEEKYKLLVKNKNCSTVTITRSKGVIHDNEPEVLPYTDLLSDYNDSQSSLVTPNLSQQEYEDSDPQDVPETGVDLTEDFSQELLLGTELVATNQATV